MPATVVTAQKKNTSGTFVLTMIISLALVFFMLLPKYKAYSDNKTANAALKETVAAAGKQTNEVESLYIQINNQKSDLAKIDLAIPDKPDTSSIYALMENMAKSANLNLSSIQAKDDYAKSDEGDAAGATVATNKISPTLGTITVNMQLSGALADFVQLLSSLEQSLRMIDVQSIDVSAQQQSAGLIFRVTLKTYYQR